MNDCDGGLARNIMTKHVRSVASYRQITAHIIEQHIPPKDSGKASALLSRHRLSNDPAVAWKAQEEQLGIV